LVSGSQAKLNDQPPLPFFERSRRIGVISSNANRFGGKLRAGGR
jgi:hypothetical protein